MAVLTPALAAPRSEPPRPERGHGYASRTFDALGTACRIVLSAARRATAERFMDESLAWLGQFEARYSRYRPDSLVSRINAAGGAWVETDAETDSLLSMCDAFHWRTRGVFDPTTLPLTRLWDHSAPNPEPPSDAAVRAALSLVGWQRVEREPGRIRLPEAGMAIELGGIGKEYAVDRLIQMAAAAGIPDILVDLGRDIRVAGAAPDGGPWKIGLEEPSDAGRCWDGLAVDRRAVAASGDYARGFTWEGRRYGHIIDPRTGLPPAHACRAVTVVAQTCTEAGILAKTAFILGPEEGLRMLDVSPQVEGFIWTDGAQYQTAGAARYLIRA